MIFLKLILSFFKIGIFSFGGGYAMIPLIQSEIAGRGWLSVHEFVDIIAIAEMTPGPIAVNSATFVGYKAAGILGGMSATIGVALPSLILAMIASKFFFKYQKHPLNIAIFQCIRPVIASQIMIAALFVAETCILTQELSFSILGPKLLAFVDIPSCIMLAVALIALVKFKIHPILVILGSGVLGAVLFSLI